MRMNRAKIFRRDLGCFLRIPCCKYLDCFVGGDVSFVLRSAEKGERGDGDGCCTLDVQESICQGVSVLMMGSSSSFDSCDEA